MNSRSLALMVLALFALLIVGAQPAQAQSVRLSITIANPAEGETFYASPEAYMYSVYITGWLVTSNPEPSLTKLRLDVLRGSEVVGSMTAHAAPDSTFQFTAMVNPAGTEFTDSHTDCPRCHFASALTLPRGPVLLRLTATDPSGAQAVTERRIVVDLSGYVAVPVQVVNVDQPAQPVANVPVVASTRLYMWRARHPAATTNASGQTQVRVEVLTQMAARYVFRVPPVVADGVWYEGVETKEVIFNPGETPNALLVLRVRARRGEIKGTFQTNGKALTAPLTVRAMDVASGAVYSTQTQSGTYTFSDLPIARYRVVVDASQPFRAESQLADLTLAPSIALTTTLAPRETLRSVRGVIRANNGDPLPFAFVTVGESAQAARALPATGEFVLFDVPADTRSIVVGAPGYWSQSVAADDRAPLAITLAPRADLRCLPWGDGAIFLPPETIAEFAGNRVALTRGWVWGSGSGAFVVEANDATITFESGNFAIERGNDQAWLYVTRGTATVAWGTNRAPIVVPAGQMLALDPRASNPRAVPLDPVVVRELIASASPLVSLTSEPTWTARLSDALAQFGINLAQVITLVTYLLVVLALIGAPALIWEVWRRLQRTR